MEARYITHIFIDGEDKSITINRDKFVWVESVWQPIETAPKDGTLIDLWSSTTKERLPDCRWMAGNWEEYRKGSSIPMGWTPLEESITHWMHRPKGPTSIEESY